MTTTEHPVSNGRVSADTFLPEETGPQTQPTQWATHVPSASVNDKPEDTPVSVPDDLPDSASTAPKGANRVPRAGFPGFAYRATGGRWVLPLNKQDTEAYEREEAEAFAAAKADAEAQAIADQLAQEQADRDEYEGLLVDAIRRTNQRRKYTVVICNLKGGAGKSPLTALFAIILGWVVKRVVTAIDNNPYGGTLAGWLGIHRDETVSIRQMDSQINEKKIDSFVDFSAPLGSNEFNVQFVVSDRVARKMSYGKEIARRVIGKAKANSIFVVNDTSNDIGAGAVEAALEESDVLLLAALNKDDKLAGVGETMDNFHEWGYDAITKHAVTVVMGVKPGETTEHYREVMGLDSSAIVVGIPFDVTLDRYAAIKPKKLVQDTRIAALELVYIVSRVARHAQDHGRSNDPLQFTQGRLVELSSGRTPVLSYVSPNKSARS